MNDAKPACFRRDGDNLHLNVRVQPRAGRNEVAGIVAGRLRLRVTAPPADGQANDAVRRLLADYLHVPVSRIELVAGQQGRDKRLLVRGPVRIPAELDLATFDGNKL